MYVCGSDLHVALAQVHRITCVLVLSVLRDRFRSPEILKPSSIRCESIAIKAMCDVAPYMYKGKWYRTIFRDDKHIFMFCTESEFIIFLQNIQ